MSITKTIYAGGVQRQNRSSSFSPYLGGEGGKYFKAFNYQDARIFRTKTT